MVLAIGMFSLVAHAQQPSPLRFVLGPDPRWLTPQQLVVHYELVNVSDASVYVNQFPGPSVLAGCETETGGIGGAAGGAWAVDGGQLARKYYLQLAPGEALMGEAVATVSPDCRRNLQIMGVYQMEDANDYGFAIPGRRITADPLPVPIEKRPGDGSSRRTGVTLDACAKGDEIVVEIIARELPLLIATSRTSRTQSKPADGLASPTGAWVIVEASSRRHPAMIVWRGASLGALTLTATTVPYGRPIEAKWLGPDVVCVQSSLNPIATAAWLVDVRQGRVLSAASLQAPPPRLP